MIKLVFSTDASGFQHPPTVLASILRRTKASVHARVYTRGFGAKSFCIKNLKVDFVRCDEPVTGTYPRHVNEAVFDRLRIIRDIDDWDRVLVLDHDMLVFCDLAEYFEESFEGNLLMGRLFGPGVTVGLQLRKRGGLPEEWAHAEEYPYFYMGPMMNLREMRCENLWDRLLEAHSSIGMDEQISLAAACGGRIKNVDKKWNLVPQWDAFPVGVEKSLEHPNTDVLIRDVRWRNGIPSGLIHWTGPPKPWHYGSKVWRADLWNSEACGWEQLRCGTWGKPTSVEIEPDGESRTKALLLRGWKVAIHSRSPAAVTSEPLILCPPQNSFPDLSHSWTNPFLNGQQEPDLIRFGSAASPAIWLSEAETLPNRLVIEGPRSREEVESFRKLGYLGEARITRNKWAAGGPHPKVLSYSDPGLAVAAGPSDDLYLSRLDSDQLPGVPTVETVIEEKWWSLSDGLDDCFRDRLVSWFESPSALVEFGPGKSTQILAELFPNTRILAIEDDPNRFRGLLSALNHTNVELYHARLDPSLPWYDLTGIELPEIEALIVRGPSGRPGIRNGALSMVGHLKPGAVVILDDTDQKDVAQDRESWIESGLTLIEEGDTHCVLKYPNTVNRLRKRESTEARNFAEIAEKIYVVSLPERTDRLQSLEANWRSMNLEFEIVEGVRPVASEIRWEEMKGMEAYGKADNLRTEYVIGAVGCKRAGIKSLETFIQSGAKTALICQDDCHWKVNASLTVERALREIPDDWDLLYFSASARLRHTPYSPHLVRLRGARFCTAILWKRKTALRLLPELAESDCEMDLFMQRNHASLNAFCVVPMPAYQAKSFSNIVCKVVQPPNI